jgi:hypothetical protein|nr:MAG TPA: CaiF/GrlA transcriptional regulator [Caudoviricetes sp.]
MKKLLTQFCIWYLAREYHKRDRHSTTNQAILNHGRDRCAKDIACEFGISIKQASEITHRIAG